MIAHNIMGVSFKMLKLDIKKLKPKGINLKGFKLKKKPSKKIILLCTIFIIVAAFVIIKIIMPKSGPAVNYTVLSKGEIVNSINVLGEVKSNESTNVYSTLNNPIKEIEVKVGDKVKAGDILAVLDSGDLEKDIEQAEATTVATESNAKTELNIKKEAYDNELYLYNNNLNEDIKNADEALNVAQINLNDKEKTYDNNKTLFDAGAITENDLNKSEIEYSTAKSEYEKAGVSLNNAKVKASQELDTAKSDYETAQTNYNNNSQRIDLEKKQSNLEKCEIKAPIDGTVTSISAVVGNPGTGTLFEIENLDSVEINTSIKEVDIANVKVGQKAEIKTDSTGDNPMDGEVISVNPSAKKTDSPQISGQSQSQSPSSSTDVSFDAKIKMDEPNENVKVGMSARINIILEKKSDIYTIPYESIVESGDSKSIYAAEKTGRKENEYVIKELPITVGLESDANVEISGDGISDGIIVIDDPSSYKVGQTIKINGR